MKRKDRISIVESNLYDDLNSVSVHIYQGVKNLQEECVSKGLIHSGTYIELVENKIQSTIMTGCKDSLNVITRLQDELNICYTKNELERIRELYNSRFNNLIIGISSGILAPILNNIKLQSISFEAFERLLIDNINHLINSYIQESKLRLKIKQDDKAIKQSKIANRIAILALITSIVSIYIAIVK